MEITVDNWNRAELKQLSQLARLAHIGKLARNAVGYLLNQASSDQAAADAWRTFESYDESLVAMLERRAAGYREVARRLLVRRAV